MKIHEYQGKEILRSFGVPVPRGIPAFTVQEAVEAAQKLGGPVWVVKAQIHAGGRGKGGGVKVAKTIDDVKRIAGEILGMQLKTHQTGPEGQKVRRLYIEDGADIQKEYYVSLVTDRATQKIAFIASSEGGMDIEEVAHATPEKIITEFIDPLGQVLAGPARGGEMLVTAELDLDQIVRGKFDLDITGHYSRPDFFRLNVNTNPQVSVAFWGGQPEHDEHDEHDGPDDHGDVAEHDHHVHRAHDQ